jgi:hypothetical protein
VAFAASALFYPVSFARSDLIDLVRGAIDPAVLDTVEFEKEDGGESVRQLALPRLPGMDEVEVQQAQFQIQSISREMEISSYTAQQGPANQGVFLSLAKPGRLKKIEVEYTPPPAPPPDQGALHVVVRAAQKGAGGLQPGVPLFAADDFDPPGSMFPRALSGMTSTALGGNCFLLRLPSVLGDAWLIQLAIGKSAVDLAPQAVPITIRSVTLDAVPDNVAVTLSKPGSETPLWSNPQLLLPSSGVQDVSFTPLAQKELAAALKNAASDAVTLPLTIKFSSASGGALGIVSRTLQARYVVRPLGTTPATIKLAGARAPFTVSAPAGLTPQSSAFRLVARCKGWELNSGSPEPPLEDPYAGLRITQANAVAQSARFEGAVFPLVNVRLYLASPDGAEAVMELHEDAAGAPAAMIGKPVVKKLDPGFRDWRDFECEPTAFQAALTSLWIVVRVTKGEVYWFASDQQGASLISLDKGVTWGAPDPRLTTRSSLLVLLFHDRSSEPMSRAPVIRVESGPAPVAADVMQGATALSPKEFAMDGFTLPQSVLSFYSRQPGSAKIEQKLQLFSRSVLDLRVETAAIFYDPFASGAAGG